jgi:hypothetical protein
MTDPATATSAWPSPSASRLWACRP